MSKLVLLAEDDDDLRVLVSAALTEAGYEVIAVQDGALALAEIMSRKLDLIMLDYALTDITADAVCRTVKDDPDLRHIPVIVLSADIALVKPGKSDPIPCDELLPKPFEIPALVERIAELIRGGGRA
ncbi:MAG: response regulator [Elusimicrobia bacterium]|nr:response regulator [Elusimicrobiota bacterium]